MSRARTALILALPALAACADDSPAHITELSIDTLPNGSTSPSRRSDGEDRGGRYEIRHIDLASGDTLRTIVRQYEPVAISDAMRVAGVEAALQNVRVDRGLRLAERPSERAMRVVPHMYPPFESFYRSRDGTLWMRRYIGEGVQSFDIFDEQGRLLGQPELPAGFGSMSVRGIREDRMYVIDTDELGVDYVVRLEIVKPE